MEVPDSQCKDSDTSSLFQNNKNSANDSNFLPFPKSVKNKDDPGNNSRKSDFKNKETFKVKDYFSGRELNLNLGQREEYGILSGESK